MLKLKEVYALKAKFTPKHCRRITWAILDNGRAFFDNVKTTIDFTGPDMSFPWSYLIDILNSVQYTVLVKRASFSDEWRHKDRPKEDQSGKTIGGQGDGQNTTDTPSTRGGYGQAGGGNNRQNSYGQGGFGGRKGFPPMEDKAMTPLGTEGVISSKGDHHTQVGVAAMIGGWDGQMSATLRSRH